MPYAIERIDTGEIVRWFGSMPSSFEIEVDGHTRRIVAPVAVGDEGFGHRFVEIVEVDFARPGQFFHQGEDTPTRDGNVITVTRHWTPWTQEEIDAFHVARRDEIAAQIEDVDDVVRAAVLVIMDELNLHSQKLTALGQAIVNGSTLAAIKTAVQAITPLPQRTAEDLVVAIRNKLGA